MDITRLLVGVLIMIGCLVLRYFARKNGVQRIRDYKKMSEDDNGRVRCMGEIMLWIVLDVGTAVAFYAVLFQILREIFQ